MTTPSNDWQPAFRTWPTFDSEVHRPAHYTQGPIECIDAMLAAFGPEAVRTYCLIAAFKYLWRHEHKGTSDRDLDKAMWYLRFATNDDPRRAHAAPTSE